jgi:lipoprotein-releasing system permease protein
MYRYFIALRYLRSRRITYLSILGVAVGVSALIIVLAVMEGFQNDFKNRIRGVLSDVIVRYRGPLPVDEVERRILAVPGVAAASPRLRGIALIVGRHGRGAVQIVGIEPEKEVQVSKLGFYVIASRLTVQGKDISHHIENWIDNLGREGIPGYLWKSGAISEEAYKSVHRRLTEAQRIAKQVEKQSQADRMLELLVRAEDPILSVFADLARPEALPETNQAVLEAQMELAKDYFPQKKKEIEELRDATRAALAEAAETRRFPSLFPAGSDGQVVLLGEELLPTLHIRPGSDETVRIYAAGGRELAPLDDEEALARGEFTVVGTFRSRMFRYDSRLVYMPLRTAQVFQGREGMVSEIGVRLDHFRNAPAVCEGIRAALPGAEVQTWAEKRKTLLAAINLEKAFLTVVLFMIIVVAGFNMLATFLMMVTEKTRDLGILKSLGGSTAGISSIFFLCGVLIALGGSALGTGAGLLFVRYINEIEAFVESATGITPFPRDVYYLDSIPTIVDAGDIFWILFPTVVLSVLLGSVFPAVKASRLNPQDALRYE